MALLASSLPAAAIPPSITTHKGSTTFCTKFREEATPTEALQKLCFAPPEPLSPIVEVPKSATAEPTPAPISAASSICSDTGSSSFGPSNNNKALPKTLLSRSVSRQGRATQRYTTDPASLSTVRLQTGCLPILKGGKVLFVSASNKPSWIFPKGGWEMDETMEESATREAFEEAGVIGTLGPKLSEVQYESRKAKKRRLESEEFLKRKKEKTEGGEKAEAEAAGEQQQAPVLNGSPDSSTAVGTSGVPPSTAITDEALASICSDASAKKSLKHSDETASVHSDASASCNFARITLFPLFVTSVQTEWPEGGRLRKAVEIDEAIQMLESRPELQAALKEVKEKNLHLSFETR